MNLGKIDWEKEAKKPYSPESRRIDYKLGKMTSREEQLSNELHRIKDRYQTIKWILIIILLIVGYTIWSLRFG